MNLMEEEDENLWQRNVLPLKKLIEKLKYRLHAENEFHARCIGRYLI